MPQILTNILVKYLKKFLTYCKLFKKAKNNLITTKGRKKT